MNSTLETKRVRRLSSLIALSLAGVRDLFKTSLRARDLKSQSEALAARDFLPRITSRQAARESLIRGYRTMAQRYATQGHHNLAECCRECAEVLETSTQRI